MSASDRPGQAAAAIEALGESPSPSDARRELAEFDAKDLAAALVSRGGGGGGGFTPVGCVLARDAPFDIRVDSADPSVLWDALYDNLWDLNPLASIPAGLGLAFDFDGSSSLVVPSEAGIWAFSYTADRAADEAWAGSFLVGGIGVRFPWVQNRAPGAGLADGTPVMAGSFAMPLPAGTQLTHTVARTTEASAGTYQCTQVYLSIVRHA